jgi:hypothetical protein
MSRGGRTLRFMSRDDLSLIGLSARGRLDGESLWPGPSPRSATCCARSLDVRGEGEGRDTSPLWRAHLSLMPSFPMQPSPWRPPCTHIEKKAHVDILDSQDLTVAFLPPLMRYAGRDCDAEESLGLPKLWCQRPHANALVLTPLCRHPRANAPAPTPSRQRLRANVPSRQRPRAEAITAEIRVAAIRVAAIRVTMIRVAAIRAAMIRSSGNDPSGSDPSGSDPSGNDPSGSDPSDSDPSGSDPSDSDPSGSGPSVNDPSGSDPSGSDPSGSDPQHAQAWFINGG